MAAFRLLLASCCSVAVTLAQAVPTVPAVCADEVPPRERERGVAFRLVLRADIEAKARELAVTDDGGFLAAERSPAGPGMPSPTLVDIIDLAAPAETLTTVRGRLAGAAADGFFVLDDDLDLVEVDCRGQRRRTVCAGLEWRTDQVAVPGPGGRTWPFAESLRGRVCGVGPRFAIAEGPQRGCGPEPRHPRGIETSKTREGTMVRIAPRLLVCDWMARDDGALLCAVQGSVAESGVILVLPDGSQRRVDLPARTCDFACDCLHVLCSDGQRMSLLRLPDLAIVRQHECDAEWLRAIDPVLAISCGGRPAVLTVWHVPTLTPLARFDGGGPSLTCAAVDRHRRWLAVATGGQIHVFSIVR